MGDAFLYDTFATFKGMKTEASIQKEQAPYLHEYYNVKMFFQRLLSSIRWLETRVINSFVEGLNENQKLPKYVLVILDKDLVEAVLPCDFGIKIKFESMISYIMREFNKFVAV